MFNLVKTVVRLVIRLLSDVSATCIAVLSVLVAVGAISRYLFARPITVMGDLGGLLFLAICFASIPPAFVAGRHVRFTLIGNLLSPRAKAAMEAASILVATFGMSIYIKVTADFAYKSYLVGCHSVNARIYEVPWMALVPISILLLVMALLIDFVAQIRYLAGSKKGDR